MTHDILAALNELTKILPDWAKERRLMILAGTELYAEKLPWNKWKVKNVRCNHCGQCCMAFEPNSRQALFGTDDEGKCMNLIKEKDEWICFDRVRLLNCFRDPIDEPECCITYEEQE